MIARLTARLRGTADPIGNAALAAALALTAMMALQTLAAWQAGRLAALPLPLAETTPTIPVHPGAEPGAPALPPEQDPNVND